jgi:hypothetical protein
VEAIPEALPVLEATEVVPELVPAAPAEPLPVAAAPVPEPAVVLAAPPEALPAEVPALADSLDIPQDWQEIPTAPDAVPATPNATPAPAPDLAAAAPAADWSASSWDPNATPDAAAAAEPASPSHDGSLFGTPPAAGFSEEPTDFATPDRSLFGAPTSLDPEATAQPVPQPAFAFAAAPEPAAEAAFAQPAFITLPDEPSTGEVPLAAASEFVTFQNTMPAEEVAFGSVQMDPSMVEQVTPGQWQDPNAVQALDLPEDDTGQVELASAHEFLSYQPSEPAADAAPAPAPGEGVIPVGIYTPPEQSAPAAEEPVLELGEAEIDAPAFEMSPPDGTQMQLAAAPPASPAPAYPPPAFAVSVPPTAPVAARPVAPAPAPMPVAPAPVVAELPEEWSAPMPAAQQPSPFSPAPLTIASPHPMPAPFQPAPAAPPPPPAAWGSAPPMPTAIPTRLGSQDVEAIEEIDILDDEPLPAHPAPAPLPAPTPMAAHAPVAPAPFAAPPADLWPPAPAAAPAAPFGHPQPPVVPLVAPPRMAAPPAPALPRPITPMPMPMPQPAPAARPAVAAAPAQPQSAIIPGEHRVIVHTLEGQVKRGTVRNLNLDAEILDLEVYAGQPPERLPAKRLKAVFFLLGPGAKPPQPSGNKLRVTFHDERQVAGFAPAYRPEDNGFFMFPADARTNTARIYIYRNAVKSIARG